MASSMLPTEQLWKLDQSNDCLLNVSEEFMASSMLPTEQLWKLDQSTDCYSMFQRSIWHQVCCLQNSYEN